MLQQLLIGAGLICVTVFVMVGFIATTEGGLIRASEWLSSGRKRLKMMTSLSAAVLWLLAAITISVWIWAITFMVLGEFQSLETAVYFAVVSFTTLGFGDVVVGQDWRLLSGMIAANGFLLFSLMTAYLIEFLAKLAEIQER
jgi:hypothetical protein